MHRNHAGMEEILARFLQVELRIVRFDPVGPQKLTFMMTLLIQ